MNGVADQAAEYLKTHAATTPPPPLHDRQALNEIEAARAEAVPPTEAYLAAKAELAKKPKRPKR